MRFLSRVLPALVLAALFYTGWQPRVYAQDKLLEHEVKAAFLYNFGKFVQWPAYAFLDESSPLKIGIVGSSPVGEELKRLCKDKTIQNRQIVIMESTDVEKLKVCQIVLFPAHFEADGIAALQALQTRPVLTVGECAHFLSSGGMIRFLIEDSKVKFEIDVENLEKAGLVASSKLLKVANTTTDSARRQ